MRFKTLVFATSVSASFFCFNVVHAADPVKILAGGPSAIKILTDYKSELEKATGASLDVSVSPIENSIAVLIKDMVDGMVAGNLQSTSTFAEKKGLGKMNLDDYQSTMLSEVTIKLGVHPDNPVTELTHDQIKDILNGKIQTWEPITGKKDKLVVLMAKNYQLASKVTQDAYNDGKPFTTVHTVVDKDGLVRGIQRDPGAIGVFTEREGITGFMPKFVRADAKQTTYLIMKKKTRPPAQKVFDFVKARGAAKQD